MHAPLFKRKYEAFSLIEIAIALVIIGILLGSVLKSSSLIESAKIQSTIKQFQEMRQNIEQYFSMFSAFPGVDAKASTHCAGANDGDGLCDFTDFAKTQAALDHLFKAGIVPCNAVPQGKIGGNFRLDTIEGKHFITLATMDAQGFLSSSQVRAIKKGLIGSESDLAQEGDVCVRGCINGARIVPLGNACVISYQFSQ